MRKTGLMLAAAAALSIAAPANAVIVNYTFGGTGTGAFSWDNSLNSLTGINLTIGTASFNLANTGSQSAGGGLYFVGRNTDAIGLLGVATNTDDFLFRFDPTLSSQSAGLFWWSNVGNTLHLDDTLTITQVASTAPVPEPATWAMMLIGFAGIGFAVRRGRKVLQPA